MRDIVVIAHNLRSAHNVGSLIRTAEGLGISRLYLTGYTPYPSLKGDERLPYLAQKIDKQISKTALGAEANLPITHDDDIFAVLSSLKDSGYQIAPLEQSAGAVPLDSFAPPDKIALVVGREVEGIEADVLLAGDHILQIKMYGRKESFNVVQAAAMAMFYLREIA